MKIGICGYGWVGKSMKDLFPDAYVYDPLLFPEQLQEDAKGFINECDITFVCVPTPVIGEGKLDTSIVEEVISWCQSPLLIIRSTVNPGDCDSWTTKYGKQIVFQPEYLGESHSHPLLDPKNRPFLVLGGSPEALEKAINLYATIYNANTTIRQVTLLEAEVIKLTENRAIAFKV